jgi:hypothetical protein
MRRLIALALLLPAAPDGVAELARKIMEDPKSSPALRRDAFHVRFLSQPLAEGRQTLLAAVTHPDPGIRNLALSVLALGLEDYRFRSLRDGMVTVSVLDLNIFNGPSRTSGQLILPKAPRGLEAGTLRPLLHNPDAKTAAYAGYLLTLLGEPDGLAPLLAYGRKHAAKDNSWGKLVYRALAAAADDGKVPLLEEMYERLRREEPYTLGDFYWTIRVLDGPNALKLRKRMRQEVGMDHLR